MLRRSFIRGARPHRQSASGSTSTTSSWKVTIIVAFIAAAGPGTAAVHGFYSKSQEIEIATREQDFQMRMAFLDRAIDPARSPRDREQVLRFLKAAIKDRALQEWAEAELGDVRRQLDELESVKLRANQAEEERDLLLREETALREQLEANTKEHSKGIAESQAALGLAQRKLRAAEDKQRKAQADLSELIRPQAPVGAFPPKLSQLPPPGCGSSEITIQFPDGLPPLMASNEPCYVGARLGAWVRADRLEWQTMVYGRLIVCSCQMLRESR